MFASYTDKKKKLRLLLRQGGNDDEVDRARYPKLQLFSFSVLLLMDDDGVLFGELQPYNKARRVSVIISLKDHGK